MATKSFFKDITINNKKDCHQLVSALEYATEKKSPTVKYQKQVTVLTKEEVRRMFTEKDKVYSY